jgi:hypothetical protein
VFVARGGAVGVRVRRGNGVYVKSVGLTVFVGGVFVEVGLVAVAVAVIVGVGEQLSPKGDMPVPRKITEENRTEPEYVEFFVPEDVIWRSILVALTFPDHMNGDVVGVPPVSERR